ncbi:MAG TPA: hypothetical protein VK158_01670 [Acidobacteriota bacterium]|nr:hypothetical protein [Acidobacteriota bacterium]
MKCSITGKEIEQNFLGKLIGTTIKDEKGKKYAVSADAQKLYKNDKTEILKHIKK